MALGFAIGFPGIDNKVMVKYRANAKKLKESVEYIPLENIVLETDSPYLAPVPFRGKRNSSLNQDIMGKTRR